MQISKGIGAFIPLGFSILESSIDEMGLTIARVVIEICGEYVFYVRIEFFLVS